MPSNPLASLAFAAKKHLRRSTHQMFTDEIIGNDGLDGPGLVQSVEGAQTSEETEEDDEQSRLLQDDSGGDSGLPMSVRHDSPDEFTDINPSVTPDQSNNYDNAGAILDASRDEVRGPFGNFLPEKLGSPCRCLQPAGSFELHPHSPRSGSCSGSSSSISLTTPTSQAHQREHHHQHHRQQSNTSSIASLPNNNPALLLQPDELRVDMSDHCTFSLKTHPPSLVMSTSQHEVVQEDLIIDPNPLYVALTDFNTSTLVKNTSDYFPNSSSLCSTFQGSKNSNLTTKRREGVGESSKVNVNSHLQPLLNCVESDSIINENKKLKIEITELEKMIETNKQIETNAESELKEKLLILTQLQEDYKNLSLMKVDLESSSCAKDRFIADLKASSQQLKEEMLEKNWKMDEQKKKIRELENGLEECQRELKGQLRKCEDLEINRLTAERSLARNNEDLNNYEQSVIDMKMKHEDELVRQDLDFGRQLQTQKDYYDGCLTEKEKLVEDLNSQLEEMSWEKDEALKRLREELDTISKQRASICRSLRENIQEDAEAKEEEILQLKTLLNSFHDEHNQERVRWNLDLETLKNCKDLELVRLKGELESVVKEKNDWIKTYSSELEKQNQETETIVERLKNEISEIKNEKIVIVNKLKTEITWLKKDFDDARRRHLEDISRIRKEKESEVERLQGEFSKCSEEWEVEMSKLSNDMCRMREAGEQEVNHLKADLLRERDERETLLASSQAQINLAKETAASEIERLKNQIRHLKNERWEQTQALSEQIERIKMEKQNEVDTVRRATQAALLQQEKTVGSLRKELERRREDKDTVTLSQQRSVEEKDREAMSLRNEVQALKIEKEKETDRLRTALQNERAIHESEINEIKSELNKLYQEKDYVSDSLKRDLGKIKQDRKGIEGNLRSELERVKRERVIEIETLREELRMVREENKRFADRERSAKQQQYASHYSERSGCPAMCPASPTNVQCSEEDLSTLKEHMKKVKDAKDREIILLETELRKVRLEKDKQILELKEDMRKLETIKRSEIAASKREMQTLLEQQEKQWKFKFSNNLLNEGPNNPTEIQSTHVHTVRPKDGSFPRNTNSRSTPLQPNCISDTENYSSHSHSRKNNVKSHHREVSNDETYPNTPSAAFFETMEAKGEEIKELEMKIERLRQKADYPNESPYQSQGGNCLPNSRESSGSRENKTNVHFRPESSSRFDCEPRDESWGLRVSTKEVPKRRDRSVESRPPRPRKVNEHESSSKRIGNGPQVLTNGPLSSPQSDPSSYVPSYSRIVKPIPLCQGCCTATHHEASSPPPIGSNAPGLLIPTTSLEQSLSGTGHFHSTGAWQPVTHSCHQPPSKPKEATSSASSNSPQSCAFNNVQSKNTRTFHDFKVKSLEEQKSNLESSLAAKDEHIRLLELALRDVQQSKPHNSVSSDLSSSTASSLMGHTPPSLESHKRVAPSHTHKADIGHKGQNKTKSSDEQQDLSQHVAKDTNNDETMVQLYSLLTVLNKQQEPVSNHIPDLSKEYHSALINHNHSGGSITPNPMELASSDDGHQAPLDLSVPKCTDSTQSFTKSKSNCRPPNT